MPRLDGTGPDGKGPRTGRGLGRCKDSKGNGADKPREESKQERGN